MLSSYRLFIFLFKSTINYMYSHCLCFQDLEMSAKCPVLVLWGSTCFWTGCVCYNPLCSLLCWTCNIALNSFFVVQTPGGVYALWKAEKISTLCDGYQMGMVGPTYACVVASISTAWPRRCLTPTTCECLTSPL